MIKLQTLGQLWNVPFIFYCVHLRLITGTKGCCRQWSGYSSQADGHLPVYLQTFLEAEQLNELNENFLLQHFTSLLMGAMALQMVNHACLCILQPSRPPQPKARRGHQILWCYRWCEPAHMGARNLNPGLHEPHTSSSACLLCTPPAHTHRSHQQVFRLFVYPEQVLTSSPRAVRPGEVFMWMWLQLLWEAPHCFLCYCVSVEACQPLSGLCSSLYPHHVTVLEHQPCSSECVHTISSPRFFRLSFFFFPHSQNWGRDVHLPLSPLLA